MLEKAVDDFGKELFHLLQSVFQKRQMNMLIEQLVDTFGKELFYLLHSVLQWR